jgi:uncharacterized coiled-coil protein SlyX
MTIRQQLDALDALGDYPTDPADQAQYVSDLNAIITNLNVAIDQNANKVVYLSQASEPTQNEWETAYTVQTGGSLPIPPSATLLWNDTTSNNVNGTYGTTPFTTDVVQRSQRIEPLAFVNVNGMQTKYAILRDVKGAGQNGGTFTNGGWRTRTLNDEYDPDGFVTLSANQFTLASGTYVINVSVPAYKVNGHQSQLYDVTNSAVVAVGTPENTGAGDAVTNHSFIRTRITIVASTTYRIEHQSTATFAGSGFGRATSMATEEVYTIVQIIRIA